MYIQDTKEQRQAFEAWCIQWNIASVFPLDDEDQYSDYNIHLLYCAWLQGQAAKAHEAEKLKGWVVVPKSEITDWYLDEDEGIYTDEPDIFLCDLEPGDVLEVKRQQCWQVECQFAAKVYEDEDNINWEWFDSKEEAEKAAAHCKAMIKAQEPSNNVAPELVNNDVTDSAVGAVAERLLKEEICWQFEVKEPTND